MIHHTVLSALIVTNIQFVVDTPFLVVLIQRNQTLPWRLNCLAGPFAPDAPLISSLLI